MTATQQSPVTSPVANMTATQQSTATFLSQASAWPSALSSYLEDGTLCCMLHTSVKFGVGSISGCRDWKPGTHKSIQALYSGSLRGQVCYAMDGQLVLDRRVAVEARDMTIFCCTALGVGSGMGAKYRKGLDIGVSAYGSGYCYLGAFAPGLRSRVARILGPMPYVADVLRLLRIFGDQYISARWQKIADGVYHVVSAKPIEAVPLYQFFFEGWSIVRDIDKTARVGVEFNYQYANYFAYKIQSIGSAVGNFLCLQEQEDSGGVACSDDESSWLLAPAVEEESPVVADVVLNYDDVNAKGKVSCNNCGFYVNPVGHEQRCFKKLVVDNSASFQYWAAAWMGDVVHRRDVRLFVLISQKPRDQMGDYEETFVRKEAQAAYYAAYSGPKVPAKGSSLHAISSAFEVSYQGKFRDDYINSVLGGLAISQLPKYLRAFTEGL